MTTGFDITNDERADLALAAVQEFARRTGQDGGATISADDLTTSDRWAASEVVGDLLADLMHLLGKDLFDQVLESGRVQFEAELCRFCGGTAPDYGVCDECGPLRCSRCDGLLDGERCPRNLDEPHAPWMDPR